MATDPIPTRPELSLMDGRFYADDPHPQLLWMRENDPVYWDEQGKVWGITLHDDLQAAYAEVETLRARPEVVSLPVSMAVIDSDVPELVPADDAADDPVASDTPAPKQAQ